MSDTTKRGRGEVSPISDDTEKRPCLDLEDSYLDAFDDSTIIVVEQPLHSTTLSSPPDATTSAMSSSTITSVKEGLREALLDPAILRLLKEAVVAPLMQQIEELKKTVANKDQEIADLHARVDELEQYSRRNCVRISGIPAADNENTDEVTMKLGAALGVTITTDMIDRSHRVGRPDQADRQIIVKFTSYRHKRLLMGVRRHLKHKTASTMGFSPPASAAEAAARSAPRGVFVNDDLTRQRARLAAKARRLKQERRIQDTWVRDGEIFIKKNEKISKVFNEEELEK